MLGSKILTIAVLWAAAFTAAAQSADSAKHKTHRDWPVWVIPGDSSRPVETTVEDTVYVKKVLGKDSIVVKKAVRDSLMRQRDDSMSRRTRDSLALHTPVAPIDSSLLTKVRINGFRVQLYSGGNSRMDKMRAQGMAQSAKGIFTRSSVYTQFISPHWVCRMGDFKTHAEAVHMLHEVRATGRFPEAVIVRCKVNSWQ